MWTKPTNMCFWAHKLTNLEHVKSDSYEEWKIEVSGQTARPRKKLRCPFMPGPKVTTFVDDRLARPTAYVVRMVGDNKPQRPERTRTYSA
jgi:hypothetical protein